MTRHENVLLRLLQDKQHVCDCIDTLTNAGQLALARSYRVKLGQIQAQINRTLQASSQARPGTGLRGKLSPTRV